eukprot:scaffold80848_cov30-Tisochrysis_lutea.AAC.9
MAEQLVEVAEYLPESSSTASSTSLSTGSVTDAGTSFGRAFVASICQSPGSKSAASSAAWSLADPSACTCDGCEKKPRSSGTRRSSSASGGRSAPSKDGRCLRWSTSSSFSMRASTPSSSLTSSCGSADEGGARGRVTPNTRRSFRSIQEVPSACSALRVIAAAFNVRPKADTTKVPDEAS